MVSNSMLSIFYKEKNALDFLFIRKSSIFNNNKKVNKKSDNNLLKNR